MNTYTHTSGLKYHTLTGKKNTKLAELKDDEFFKHLGNIQNAKGESPIDATHMYDGSEATNIYEKIKTELAALRARNITAGGTLQAIKTVVYRQILYPMTYANTNHMVLDKFQRLINTTLRNKFKMPSHLHTDTLYMHEDAGGIGQDEIIDMVNIDRLVLLVSCLNQSGEMNTIMTGAVERLQEYAGISTNPLNTAITHYTTKPTGMWLYQLKEWMEKHQIETDTHNWQTDEACIMDVCTRKTDQNDVWKWTRMNGIKYIKDTVYPDGETRENIYINVNNIRSNVLEQTAQWRKHNKQLSKPVCGNLTPGRWIRHNSGEVGEIVQDTNGGPDIVLVQQYLQQSRGYAATEQYKIWTTADCTEVKCNKNKTKVQIEDIQLTAAQNQDTEVVHTQRAERNEEVYITPGLVNYCLRQEAKNTLLQMNHDENNRLAGVSDGSVRDSREQGTWAWALLEYDERQENSTPLLWGIEGKGREYVEGLDTHEEHSYRMEALGLLSALQYVRSELKWKGKLDWYMDSQAVIDTFAKCHRLNDSRWIKQRDKDVWGVWVELIKEKKR